MQRPGAGIAAWAGAYLWEPVIHFDKTYFSDTPKQAPSLEYLICADINRIKVYNGKYITEEHFMKYIFPLLMLVGLLMSCGTENGELSISKGTINPSPSPSEGTDEYNQLYIFHTNYYGVGTSLPLNNTSEGLFSLNNEVIGVPFIMTEAIINGFIPGFVDESQDKNFQWSINGKISNGKMDIKFPNSNFILGPLYESTFTDGVGIAEILISNESGSVGYELNKLLEKDTIDFGNYEYTSHRVHIYYAEKDFNKFNNGKVSLKAGWNFVETYTLLHKDGRKNPFEYETGLVSRDINDFYKAGYRWFYSGTANGGTSQ